MKITKPLTINCGTHGKRVCAVVCKHMLQGEPTPAGFIENSDDPNNLQAWCCRCEKKFLQEGHITEAFKKFNGMVTVCDVCYKEAKSLHTTPDSE